MKSNYAKLSQIIRMSLNIGNIFGVSSKIVELFLDVRIFKTGFFES